MLYKFNEFNEFKDRESYGRSKPLSEDEFLKLFKENCKNFSFNNDQLWRNKASNDFSIFIEGERKQTIGTYNYKDFFDTRKEYPVPRYKSLIGSTSDKGTSLFASFSGDDNTHLVIPFDNTQIVFASTPDMAILSHLGVKNYTDDMFKMVEYTKDFKFPEEYLKSKCIELIGMDMYKRVDDHGFEFFTNGPCLLLKKDKIDWLKSLIN